MKNAESASASADGSRTSPAAITPGASGSRTSCTSSFDPLFTTRDAAMRVSHKRQYSEWHEPEFQTAVLERMRKHALSAGRRFGTGPGAFSWLAEVNG